MAVRLCTSDQARRRPAACSAYLRSRVILYAAASAGTALVMPSRCKYGPFGSGHQ